MSSSKILQLFPPTGSQHELQGLYLEQNIRQCKDKDGVFIYSNFISSIDGRIALPAEDRESHQVPATIANQRDWRLYQELAAQADLLITSARYFRQAEHHEEQDKLPVGPAAEFDDLRQWRLDNGLKEQPDIAIFSASLDIPVKSLSPYKKRKLYIFTGRQSNLALQEKLHRESNAEIIVCGNKQAVDGKQLRTAINRLGYRTVYAIAGPSVLSTLATGDALDRLYLTTANCLLGGKAFDTINWGDELRPAMTMPLQYLYYDPGTPDGAGQTLAVYGR